MDTGKEWGVKTLSPEPLSKIEAMQKAIQEGNAARKFVHLAGRGGNRMSSVIIPLAASALAVPVLGYGMWTMWTQSGENG
eukprot:evm.model.scf_786.2 EVM.evm.TU.scf_786.2   scf_786:9641-10475(-)